MVCNPPSSLEGKLEGKVVTERSSPTSREYTMARLEDRRGYRLRDLVLVAVISAFSSIIRWILVHTAHPAPRSAHRDGLDQGTPPHTAAHTDTTVATEHQTPVTLDATDDREPMTLGDNGMLREVDASGRFIKDSNLGRILHPGRGKVSYRQAVRENSLHLVVHGTRVSAHIDRKSPLAFDEHGTPHCSLRRTARYSLKRVLTHSLTSLADLALCLIPRHWIGHQRTFYCERTDIDGITPSSPSNDRSAASEATAGRATAAQSAQ